LRLLCFFLVKMYVYLGLRTGDLVRMVFI